MTENGAPEVSSSEPLTIIVPVYNEEHAVEETVHQLCALLDGAGGEHRLIVVEDGSTDDTRSRLEAIRHPRLKVLAHSRNRGYGAALKTGILAARTPLVAITDADGTYPNDRIFELAARLGNRSMVVGARSGKGGIPLIRRPAKWAIGTLANYLAQFRIPDLNSGLRVMRRDSVLCYLSILPNGFSFTTTITLAMLTCGEDVEYVPITYLKRIGKSKIKPIRDTLNFVQLIIRTVLLFEPLRVFLPISILLFLGGVVVFAGSAIWLPKILDTTTALLTLGGLQMLGIGMIAEMINRRLDRRLLGFDAADQRRGAATAADLSSRKDSAPTSPSPR